MEGDPAGVALPEDALAEILRLLAVRVQGVARHRRWPPAPGAPAALDARHATGRHC